MYKFLFKLWGLLILEDPTANKPIGSIPQLQVPFRGRRANRIYFSKAMCMWGNIAFPLLFELRSKEGKESGSKCLDYGLLLSIMCESPSFFPSYYSTGEDWHLSPIRHDGWRVVMSHINLSPKLCKLSPPAKVEQNPELFKKSLEVLLL